MIQHPAAAIGSTLYPDLLDSRAQLFRGHQDVWHDHAEQWEGRRPDIAAESRRMASKAGMRAITIEVLRSVPGAHMLQLSRDGGLRLISILDEHGNLLTTTPEVWDRLRSATADCLDRWTGGPEAEEDFAETPWGDLLVPIHGKYETKVFP